MPHSISDPSALEGRTLLDELNHRIKNELASVINLVSFKAVWTDNIEAKEELSNVVDLLHQHAEVHTILTMPDRDGLVDAGEQLRKLGLATCRCKLDRMNIHLLLSAIAAGVRRCWRLALAELVTNGPERLLRRPRRRNQIKLMRAGSWVNCRVTGAITTRKGQAGCGADVGDRQAWAYLPHRHRPRSPSTSLSRSASSTPTARSSPAAREAVVG